MDVFKLRDRVIQDYANYVRSFVKIRDPHTDRFAEASLRDEALWPQPLIQMNPSFAPGGWIDDLIDQGLLHNECRIFRIKSESDPVGSPIRLHKHQVDAILAARAHSNYVLTTGTGSGKSLAYIIPIVDHVLHTGPGNGILFLMPADRMILRACLHRAEAPAVRRTSMLPQTRQASGPKKAAKKARSRVA